jgi:peptidoglycan/LPS O-acetylase OafA/YrhL
MHLDTLALAQPTQPDLFHGRTEQQSVVIATDDKAFSRWLDLFRWVAALSVVFAHSENRFLMRIADLASTQRTLPLYLFSFAAGFAHQAVMIFFVLSGYLVGGGLWREAKREQAIDLPKYLVRRVSRLCIVLYPTFLLIGLLNAFGIGVFHGIATGAYSADVIHSMGPAAFVCNATFFNTALCRNYGGDGALWSLYNEFWYYIVWPLILLALYLPSAWKRILCFVTAGLLLTILTLLQFEGSAIGPYMLIWLLGVGVAWMPRPIIRSYALSGALFIAGLLAVRMAIRRTFGDIHPISMFFVDLLLSALFANLLITMKHNSSLRSPVGKDWNYRFAAFSFSLYCIHTPILNLYGAALKYYTGANLKMVPDHFWKWGLIFGAVGLSCAAGFFFSRVTEAHTAVLRAWLMRLFKLNIKEHRPAIALVDVRAGMLRSR